MGRVGRVVVLLEVWSGMEFIRRQAEELPVGRVRKKKEFKKLRMINDVSLSHFCIDGQL